MHLKGQSLRIKSEYRTRILCLQAKGNVMAVKNHFENEVREPVLSPVDRISEMLFGLMMALSHVGAILVSGTGATEVQAMFDAALGCNLA